LAATLHLVHSTLFFSNIQNRDLTLFVLLNTRTVPTFLNKKQFFGKLDLYALKALKIYGRSQKMKARWIVMIFLGFSLAISVPADSQKPDEKQAAEIVAIQQIRENLDAAYNRRDATAFSELFFEDADFQWHTGALLKDREEIRQHFVNSFMSMPTDYRHITVFQRIRFLAPDIAIGDGTVVIARDRAADNEKPYLKVLLTCVGRKDKGRWRIAAVRLMPISME
jgi:uncharacterized protein (TIGR02246 family)